MKAIFLPYQSFFFFFPTITTPAIESDDCGKQTEGYRRFYNTSLSCVQHILLTDQRQ